MKKAYIYISIATALYIFQVICKLNQVNTPLWFSSYFSDLLCLPLLLSYTLIVIRKIKNASNLLLNWRMILAAFIYVSVVFEFVLPMLYKKFTSDIFDIVTYAIGAMIYYYFQKSFLSISKA